MNSFSVRSRLIKRLISYTYPMADAIICQSRDIYEDLAREVPSIRSQLHLIPNPLLPMEKVSLRREVKSGDPLELVVVGNFRKEKGHLRLLPILKRVSRKFHVTFVGDGELKEQVSTEAERLGLLSSITFAGMVNPPYSIVAKAHLYLQTSYVEGFPNAMLEALGLGVPCVAYNVPGGTKELINEFNGMLIEDGDVAAFSSALEHFETGDYNSSRIREDALQRFSVESIVKKYRGLIDL